ncbi:MAG: trypsin-like peptidase domain-containing protein [Planctomycetota bacterium]|nr:trypsin-like peptidase domain-containing protein [Planctomycetota bacterium]
MPTLRLHRLLPLAAVLCVFLASPALSPLEADEDNPRRDRIVKLVERTRNAVVSIRTPKTKSRMDWFPFQLTPRGSEDASLGSGTIFHPAGYLVTNAHVIAQADTILVDVPEGDGSEATEYEAIALAADIPNDLAILRLLPRKGEDARSFPHLDPGTSGDLMLGETCITLGHPLKLGFTVTRGIISGLDRSLKMAGGFRFDDFIQVDAAVNLGNSGGPLFDVTGRWIGVNTAIYRRGGMSTAEGVGFAIPIDRVRSLISKAFKRRMITGHWYGLDFVEGEGGAAQLYRVYPKGPARESGLRPDDIVTHVNGKRVGSLYDLRMRMATLPLSSQVTLQVLRDGKPLGRRVELRDEEVPTRRLSWQHLGFEVSDTEFNGVLLTRVREGSPAEEIKLRSGDIIEALGPFKIRNSDDLLRFLQVVEAKDTFEVHIKRFEQIRGRTRVARMRGTMKAE